VALIVPLPAILMKLVLALTEVRLLRLKLKVPPPFEIE
jgi:hypothetical protein